MRPRKPSTGLWTILLRYGGTAMPSGPSESPGAESQRRSSLDFPASLLMGLAWLRPGGTRHWCLTLDLSIFLDTFLDAQSSCSGSRFISLKQNSRAHTFISLPQSMACCGDPHLTCPALRLSGGQSLLFQGLLSISLHLCHSWALTLSLCACAPADHMAQIRPASLWIHL